MQVLCRLYAGHMQGVRWSAVTRPMPILPYPLALSHPLMLHLAPVQLLYHLFLILYRLGIGIAALWNPKARLWQQGRRGQWKTLRTKVPPSGSSPRIWMHCASLGEFEQGRPILESLKSQYPSAFIVLTFFSPSGYEVRRNYDGADVVCYLPMDGPGNARRFLDIIQPTIALFVKYEFWHYYLKDLHNRHIPTILVSGAFRKSQPFFQWWGAFFRRILTYFTVITVQDKKSLALLQGRSLAGKAHLTGDTRYDRVVQIATEARELPRIAAFKGPDKLIIAGSTWPEDEQILHACLPSISPGWKLVIAPHEIHEAHLNSIKSLFGTNCTFYSSQSANPDARVLIIDNIGMLSALYRYGEIACVGGGYSKSGIHNVLEPAVFGLPVIIGPEYQKFTEAVQLVKKGFAFAAKDATAYGEILQHLISDEEGLTALQGFTRSYIQEHTGATAKIISLIAPL
jgi:3-deoxy-D-manno-octulosonic-acid transferase